MQFEIPSRVRCYISVKFPCIGQVDLEAHDFSGYSRDGRRKRLFGGGAGLRRWLRIVAGGIMVLAGLFGLALPILPGWVWLIPGLMILAREFTPAKRILEWLRSRLPQKTAPDG